MAGLYNFRCAQGATFEKTLTWKDAEGELVPLDGYTARMQVRDGFDAEDTIVDLSTDEGTITLTDPGEITVVIPADKTAEIDAGTSTWGKRYRYDLELVSPQGRVKRLLEGRFIVTPEVTK